MLILTLFSLLLEAAPSHAAVVDLQKRSALTDCLTAASVPQNAVGSADFIQAIKPFNLRIPFTPIAVAVPTTVAQVQAAVSCGVQNNATISPKSGGHSYASHGLGGEDGHFMIDMKMFNNVSVDSTTGIASIGPGGRLGNVATSLFSQGQRAFSHGTCPGVGVGGHVVGGGYGYSSHTKGLALDNLVEATVVLANSTVVTTSTTQNPDLFWALRGAGGGSFGVITQYKFQTFPAPSANTVFSYNIFGWNQAQASTVHAALQAYAGSTQMPAEMNLRLYVTSYSLQLEGLYYGNQSAFQAAIAPFSQAIGGAYWTTSTQGWIQSLNNYAYMSLAQPLNYDIHETFFSKSLMTINLTQAAFDAFWAYGAQTAKSVGRDWYLIIDAHGGPTSAISQVPADATSYAHRNATLKYEFYDRVDTGSYPSDGFSFLNGWVQSALNAMPQTQFGMYINYADTSLTAQQAHTNYWLGHYQRLSEIKKSLDPQQRFSNPQAIWPAAG